MSTISFNPNVTTNIAGGFVLSTEGYVQGVFLDDPSMRTQLEGGQVGSGVSQPLWGGQAVELNVQGVGQNAQGSTVIPSTSAGTIHGWTLFNQAMAGIITPSSQVPLYAAGASINFARVGSLLRVCVAVESLSILNALASAAANVPLYWDPTNLCISNSASSTYALPANTQLLALSATSKTVTYSGGNATWNATGPAAIIRI
jgi:hypothetical protein